MSSVLIFGATGRLGRILAYFLRNRGAHVAALVRPQSDTAALEQLGVECTIGDALEPSDVVAAMRRLRPNSAVVSLLSGKVPEGEDAVQRSAEEHGNISIIKAAKSFPIERLLLVTAIGCGEMLPYRSTQAIAAFGAIVEAKSRAEQHLRASGLPFTILRPGGLTNDAASGEGILTTDPQVHGSISRAELAVLIDRVLRDKTTRGGVYAAVERNRARSDAAQPPAPVELAP